MKILQLHIRNIASIERGDIDFEHDLCNAQTGAPEQLFLISGETGAGKTAILDSICLALYGTTPRLQGVANSKMNEYSVNDDETMSVNSVAQYTRIGITDKNPCYAEVVFEGNDGRMYTARFALGMKRAGDKTWAYRSKARWTLRAENEDEISGKTEVAPRILQAVGLTFEQFCRMAMLAQGDFAAFMLGKQEERAGILERLTNTEQFSKYGEAIAALAKRADEAYKHAKERYEEAGADILGPEAKGEAEASEKALVEEQEGLKVRDQLCDTLLSLVRQLEESEADEGKNTERLARLDEERRGAEYVSAETFVHAWDATEEQRRSLTQKREAEARREAARTSEQKCGETFGRLSAYLAWYRGEAARVSDEADRQQRWIEERQAHAALYTRAGETVLRIRQYGQAVRAVADLTKKIEEAEAQCAALTQATQTARQKADAAAEAVAKKQAEIDARTAEYDALEPEAVQRRLDKAKDRQVGLTQLSEGLQRAAEERKSIHKLAERVEAGQQRLATLGEEGKQLSAAYNNAKAEDDAAQQALLLGKMSLDEKLTDLRHKLREEHAEVCPLCGQHLDHILQEAGFEQLLTPVEARQKATSEALAAADKRLKEARAAYSKLQGQVQAETRQLMHQKADHAEAELKLQKAAQQLALTGAAPLSEQVEQALGDVAAQLTALQEQRDKAIVISKTIQTLQKAKTPLDTASNKAAKQLQTAEKTESEHTGRLQHWREQRDEKTEDVKKHAVEIDEALGDVQLSYADDVEAACQRLEEEAKAYTSTVATHDRGVQQAGELGRLIGQMQATREKIIAGHAAWDAPCEALRYAGDNVLGEWQQLFADVRHAENERSAAEKIVDACARSLAEYYAQTNTTEDALAALIARAGELTAAREAVSKMAANRLSAREARDAAEAKGQKALQALGFARADVPSVALLEREHARLSAAYSTNLEARATVRERLKNDRLHVKEYLDRRAVMEKASAHNARWGRLNAKFGGTKLRTIVQSHILRGLLERANVYLQQITDQYLLRCDQDNAQLSILVLDRYNKQQVRSTTVLSGGERFMISLALSLALSMLNRPGMNVDILFIDEGFGTLDNHSLDSVMQTLDRLGAMPGNKGRRVGVISHRTELAERIPLQIQVKKHGAKSSIEIV